MKKILLLFILALGFTLHAQRPNPFETTNADASEPYSCPGVPTPGDLVINGNFEQNSSIPTGSGQITLACGWYSPSTASPDYFHRNSQSGIARIPDTVLGPKEVNPTEGGDAFAGFGYNQNIREMIRTQLLTPLESFTEYTLEFDVSVSPSFGNGGVIQLQAYLGPYIQSTTPNDLPIDPSAGGILLEEDTPTTNTTGWDTITFTFTTGLIAGQEYLYLGGLSDVAMSGGTVGYNFIDNVSLKPANSCGTCTDAESQFPLVSDSYTVPNNSGTVIGKTITTDCSGNIYSLGYWDGSKMLNKYDLFGNLIWSQNVTIGDAHLLSNTILEVDENESIFIKYRDRLYKYDSNGILTWEILINNAPYSSNLTINKETGDLYLPINTSTTLTNITAGGTNITFTLMNDESNILKIDTNANITDLGVFSSEGVINLHYNAGLKVWNRNSSGIAFRKYELDVLVNNTTTWLNNILISNYDNLSPLFYNHINDEVYVYTGNILASNNNNTRVLSIDGQGNINANILLPEAVYIGQHIARNQPTYSFNQKNGALAVYADNYQNTGSCFISTIDSSYGLSTKALVSSLLSPNPFYSRSFHGITYGGGCIYLYGHYRSTSNITLDGGIILPPSGANSLRSFVIRLQDDLDIESQVVENTISEDKATENQVIVVQNPIQEGTIHLKFKEDYPGEVIYMLYDMNGNLISDESGFLDQNQKFNLDVAENIHGILFLKVIRDDGFVEVKRIIVE